MAESSAQQKHSSAWRRGMAVSAAVDVLDSNLTPLASTVVSSLNFQSCVSPLAQKLDHKTFPNVGVPVAAAPVVSESAQRGRWAQVDKRR